MSGQNNNKDYTYETELTALKFHNEDSDMKMKSSGLDCENSTNERLAFTPSGNKTNGTCSTLENEISYELKVTSGWKNLFFDYSQDTTLHGVRYITLETRFVIRRLFWTLVTCGALSLFIYYLVNRVTFYLQYQKSVNVEVNYVDKVEFPAVTLCNQNQFKLTSSANGGYYPEVHKISHSLSSSGILSCPGHEFKCDEKCIPLARVCDGMADCQDKTDEKPDKCGCIRMEVTGTTNSSLLEQTVLNKVYEYDQSQIIGDRHMYYADNITLVYLYYHIIREQWVFSTTLSHKSDNILLYTEDQVLANISDTPDLYNGKWVVNDSSHTLKFTCIGPSVETQDMNSLAKTKVDNLKLKYMYDNGSHNVNDMIQSCSWKGRPCSAKKFDVLDTDFGRCYRYNPSGPVEQSGPGFGLAVTVNIQQYEYTKNTQDGVGVQVLLHSPKEPPVMTERAFAISPGLYTMVSIERTEVVNLAPPWGKCGVKKLEYYDDYSIATCNLNCLNKLARSICKCRDLYMPQILDKSAHYNYCEVDKYISCWKPKLDEFRKHGNFCSCSTQCSETLYVPSLSFASITSDQDLLSGEDLQKMIKMQENLIQAREITYRIQTDKYLETMRIFKSTIRQVIQTDTRLLMTKEIIRNELTEIKSVMSEVYADCLWFMNEEHKLVQRLHHIYGIITETYDTVKDKVYFKLELLYQKLIMIYNCWDHETCGFNYCMNNDCGADCCCGNTCFHPRANTWRYLLNPWYTETKELIKVIQTYLKFNLLKVVSDMFDSMTIIYKLSQQQLTPLMPYLRTNCSWCVNQKQPLFRVLKSKLMQSMITRVIPSIRVLQNTLDDMHRTYFDNGNFLNFTRNSVNRSELLSRSKDIATSAYNSLNIIDKYLKQPVTEARDIIEDLLRLITPKCGSELQKLYNEYADQHDRMDSDIQLLNKVVKQHGKKFADFQNLYRSNELSLTALHKTSGSTELKTYVQGVNVTIDSTFKVRSKATERLQNHIGVIYYWISAQVPDKELSSKSLIWKRFKIDDPVFINKNSHIGSAIQIEEQFFMKHSNMTQFWTHILEELENSRINMGIGVKDLLSQLEETHRYLSHFVEGNQISESFYQKNYLQIDIFYKELTERNIMQQKAYELPALLGEVGGLMGLLLGASVMTLVEFCDLLVYNAINKCVEKKQKYSRKRRQNSLYS